MKKYKHKNTGNIAVETHSEKNYKVSQPQNFTVPKWIIENSDDWQEVVELDYEILSYVFQDRIFNFSEYLKYNSKRNNSRHYECEDGGLITDHGIYSLIKNPKIHSIKRLSDNEVFTIGDLCYPDSAPLNCGKITKFETCKPGYFRIKSENKYYIGLDNLVKAKKPLFVTEDGVDLHIEDNYCPASIDGSFNNFELYSLDEGSDQCQAKSNGYLWFSNAEKARTFVDENKPKYSEKDMLDFGEFTRACYTANLMKTVLSIWKSK